MTKREKGLRLAAIQTVRRIGQIPYIRVSDGLYILARSVGDVERVIAKGKA